MASILGTDIKLNFEEGDIVYNNSNDFAKITDEDNLKQAILKRLFTKKGELSYHSEYGSDLYKLFGANADDDTLNLAGVYTYEALEEEPRILTINSVTTEFRVIDTVVNVVIFIDVTPITDDVPINMVINYEIE